MTQQPAHALDAATPDASLYNAYVAGLELRNVEVVRVNGERTGPGSVAHANFDTSLSYAHFDEAINYRYDVVATLFGESGAEIGRVEVAVVLVTISTSPADEATIAHFAGTSAAMMAFPFVREAVASTAQKIGFLGVVMPIVRTTQPRRPGDAANGSSDPDG